MVIDANMKQLENSMETLEMCNMSSISYPANVNTIFEFFPRSPQLWLIDVGYALWNSLSKLSKGLWHLRLVYLVCYMTSIAIVITFLTLVSSSVPPSVKCTKEKCLSLKDTEDEIAQLLE
jgi:hypothetical protein